MQSSIADTLKEKSRRRSLRRLHVYGALLLIALMIGIQLDGLRRSYHQYEERARLNAQNLGNVLAENIAGTFQNIDLTLLAAIDRIALQRPPHGIDTRAFDAAMQDLKRRVPWLISLRVTNATGEIVFGTELDDVGKISLGDRDYFLRIKSDPHAGMVISAPLISRVSHTWVLPCGRRYNLPDGTFGGMVYGTVEIDGLAERLMGRKLQLNDKDILILRDNDENVIVRYSHRKQDMRIMGSKTTSAPSAALLHSTADAGFYVSKSTIDGIEHIYYFRRVAGQAMNLIVGLSTDDALAGWRDEVISTGVATLIFALMTGGLSTLLYRSRVNNLLTRIKLEKARHEAEQARMIVEDTGRQVVALLDNSGQGFLSFGADLRVAAEYSSECERIFFGQTGVDMAGSFLPLMLYPDDPKQFAAVRENLRCIFTCDDAYLRDLYVGLLPAEYRIRNRDHEAQYRYLNDGKMMLILTDISDEKALQEKIRLERQHVDFLVHAMENRNSLLDTLDGWRRFQTELLPALLDERMRPRAALIDLHREIHTYKGLFAQEGLPSMPQALHALEDRLADLIRRSADITQGDLRRACEVDLHAPLEADLAVLREKLGEHYFAAGRLIQIPAALIDQIEADALTALGGRRTRGVKLLEAIHSLRHQSISSLLEPHFKAAVQLAARLQRELATIRYEGDDVQVDPRLLSPFCKSLMHVFRNCVDHGIEDAETRFGAGKSVAGHIHCRGERRGDELLLSIGDDGRGIDVERLRAHAAEQGLLSAAVAAELDQHAALRLIFADGLSTRDHVTEISGRGVGLAATLYELDKLGGTVEIMSSAGKGTEFRFTLPLMQREFQPNRNAPSADDMAPAHDDRMIWSVLRPVSAVAQTYLQTTHDLAGVAMNTAHRGTDESAIPATAITATVRLDGRIQALVAFSFEDGLLDRLFRNETSGLTIPEEQIAFYLRETAAETANIILGHSLAALTANDATGNAAGSTRITLAPPVVTQGMERQAAPSRSTALITAHGNLVVTVIEV